MSAHICHRKNVASDKMYENVKSTPGDAVLEQAVAGHFSQNPEES